MRETKNKQIGDVEYSVVQLPDIEASRLWMRLVRIFAPVMGAGLKALPDKSAELSIGNLTTQAIGEALISFAGNMTEEDYLYLYDTFSIDAQFNNGSGWVPLKSDKSHWAGRHTKKLQWLVFAMEVNYSDFLGGTESIARLISMFRSALQSKSQVTLAGEPRESSQASTTT